MVQQAAPGLLQTLHGLRGARGGHLRPGQAGADQLHLVLGALQLTGCLRSKLHNILAQDVSAVDQIGLSLLHFHRLLRQIRARQRLDALAHKFLLDNQPPHYLDGFLDDGDGFSLRSHHPGQITKLIPGGLFSCGGRKEPGLIQIRSRLSQNIDQTGAVGGVKHLGDLLGRVAGGILTQFRKLLELGRHLVVNGCLLRLLEAEHRTLLLGIGGLVHPG